MPPNLRHDEYQAALGCLAWLFGLLLGLLGAVLILGVLLGAEVICHGC